MQVCAGFFFSLKVHIWRLEPTMTPLADRKSSNIPVNQSVTLNWRATFGLQGVKASHFGFVSFPFICRSLQQTSSFMSWSLPSLCGLEEAKLTAFALVIPVYLKRLKDLFDFAHIVTQWFPDLVPQELSFLIFSKFLFCFLCMRVFACICAYLYHHKTSWLALHRFYQVGLTCIVHCTLLSAVAGTPHRIHVLCGCRLQRKQPWWFLARPCMWL